jgi:hypothetical protein
LPGITRNPRPNRSFLLLNYCLGADPLLEPLLPGVIGAGLVVLGLVVLGLVVLGLVVLGVVALPPTVPPAPAPARASRRHFSRCSPRRSLHLASMLASAEPVALPPALVPVEGDTVPPAAAPPLTPEPDEAPVLPDVEPEDCAKAADDKARSAAAVAAVIAFNIMWVIS